MQNVEEILTHFNFIISLKNAGFTSTKIVQDVNNKLACNISPRQLRDLINKVNNKTIHNEYNNIIMFNHLHDAWDANLNNYCVNFHGLLITYKNSASLTDPAYIITPDNLIKLVSHKESLLYAKRILKLYDIDDEVLLEQHRKHWPKQPEINLAKLQEKIHREFNSEFNNMLTQLHNLYVNFLINHSKGVNYAPTKNV